jgi:hypothetical protein
MQQLQSHIALHLERFAMFSLPRHISGSEESEIGSNAFTDHSENEKSFHIDLDLESNVADESRDSRRRAYTIIWSDPSVLTEDGTYRYDDSPEQVQHGTHPQLESMVPLVHSDFELTESTPPVSEALLPIYSQLLALKQNLFRVRDTGDVSPVRELLPYKMKVGIIGELQLWSGSLFHVLTFLSSKIAQLYR